MPLANFSTSNTPAGPFHTTVFAPTNSFLKSSIVFGPQSSPCESLSIFLTSTTFVSAFAIAPKKSAATSSSETLTLTTSTGKIILPLAFSSNP